MSYANVRRHNNQSMSHGSEGNNVSSISAAMISFPRFVRPMQGESIVLIAHPSSMNYVWWIVFGVLLIPFLLVGVAMLVYVYITLKTTCYVVTNKRVVAKVGWLNVKQSEVRIDDIRAVNLKLDLWQRIIGTGDITIGTAATGGAEIVMVGIGNPSHVVEAINAQREQ